MNQSVTNQFQAALGHLLIREGRGAQSRLASEQNLDRGYVNAIVKGRKPGSDDVKAKIAGHFNMTYEEMLSLGRGILSGDKKRVSEENPETIRDFPEPDIGVTDGNDLANHGSFQTEPRSQ